MYLLLLCTEVPTTTHRARRVPEAVGLGLGLGLGLGIGLGPGLGLGLGLAASPSWARARGGDHLYLFTDVRIIYLPVYLLPQLLILTYRAGRVPEAEAVGQQLEERAAARLPRLRVGS